MIVRLSALWLILVTPPLHAGEVTLAVASNFIETAESIAERFEAETAHDVTIAHGSTGQLFAQIVNGAPYDVFLAADSERPERLQAAGLTREVRTYALGRLALASQVPIDRDTVRDAFAGRTVALADPTVAPYGRAATRAMEVLGLDTATFRPILVANVGQVATVFATGNADFAFVSVSQLRALAPPQTLSLDEIAPPIRQDAALLRDTDAANAFWAFLFADDARAIIEAAGYGLPE